jgi:ADP-ribosylglycohydrolase
MRWTDDTQMSLDLVESMVALGTVDPDDLAQRFAKSYRWSRGYGPGAAKILKRIARGSDWNKGGLEQGRENKGTPIYQSPIEERPIPVAPASAESGISHQTPRQASSNTTD